MRLPRIKFTIRRMMAVVGVLAVMMGLALEIQRRGKSFRKLAAYHRESAHLIFGRDGMPRICNKPQSKSEIDQVYASSKFGWQ
jgi:hypothetical protein